MKSYCFKCKKDTGNINPRVSNIQNVQNMAVKCQDSLKFKKQKNIK